MRVAVVLTVVAVALVTFAYAERARACGTWSLDDRELDGRVVFHASTVSVTSKKQGGQKHILRIDDDGSGESVRSIPHGWTKHTPPPPVHTFDGKALLLHGKRIGEVGDGAFTIHG